MAVLKIHSGPFRVVFKTMSSSTYIQMKNLTNAVYGEIKSKSQTRREFAPPDGLGPAGLPCPQRVLLCVKAFKGRVGVTEKASGTGEHRGRGLLGEWKRHAHTFPHTGKHAGPPSSAFASLQFYFSISGDGEGLKN